MQVVPGCPGPLACPRLQGRPEPGHAARPGRHGPPRPSPRPGCIRADGAERLCVPACAPEPARSPRGKRFSFYSSSANTHRHMLVTVPLFLSWAGLCRPPAKFLGCGSDPQDLKMCLYLDVGSLKRRFSYSEVVRVAPTPYDRCPRKKRSGHSPGDDHGRTQGEDCRPRAQERGPGRNQPPGSRLSAPSPEDWKTKGVCCFSCTACGPALGQPSTLLGTLTASHSCNSPHRPAPLGTVRKQAQATGGGAGRGAQNTEGPP